MVDMVYDVLVTIVEESVLVKVVRLTFEGLDFTLRWASTMIKKAGKSAYVLYGCSLTSSPRRVVMRGRTKVVDSRRGLHLLNHTSLSWRRSTKVRGSGLRGSKDQGKLHLSLTDQ